MKILRFKMLESLDFVLSNNLVQFCNCFTHYCLSTRESRTQAKRKLITLNSVSSINAETKQNRSIAEAVDF